MKKVVMSLMIVLTMMVGFVSAEVVSTGDSPMFGDANAPVTLIHFVDFQGPFNFKFYDETLPEIVENYIDEGDVKLVVMNYPLISIHPQAGTAAEAAHCVRDQGGDLGYFSMYSTLFENQDDFSDDNLLELVDDIDADLDLFEECMEDGKHTLRIEREFEYAKSLGIRGTPAFFINGEKVAGAPPFEDFEELIEEALADDIDARVENLEEDLSLLEEGILDLLDAINYLIQEFIPAVGRGFEELEGEVRNNDDRLDNLENITPSEDGLSKFYLNYVSSSTKRKMVCGYAQENHLDHYEDLNLSCDLKYRTLRNGKERVSCKCKRS